MKIALTNFSKKGPISKSYHKNVALPEGKLSNFKFQQNLPQIFLLAQIFQLHKYQEIAFINLSATHKRQQGSVKFRIWEVLILNWRSFQFSKKLSCLHLKEISAIFSKTLVVQN